MSYQSFASYPKAWIFKRKDPEISDADLEQLLVMSELRANQLWQDYVSKTHLHPDHFDATDWLKNPAQQLALVNWEKRWESNEMALPAEVLQHLEHWGDDTRIYFAYNSDEIIETSWGVFQRSWKNFLFFDNGPVLLGKKKQQAVQFFSDGKCQLLNRSA
mgnify:FL=1